MTNVYKVLSLYKYYATCRVALRKTKYIWLLESLALCWGDKRFFPLWQVFRGVIRGQLGLRVRKQFWGKSRWGGGGWKFKHERRSDKGRVEKNLLSRAKG